MDRRSVLVALGAVGISAELACKLQPSGATGSRTSAPGVKAPPATLQQMPPPIGRVSIKSAPLGAGGFVTGIDISNDGERFVCRTDVANAYIRSRQDRFWTPLFSAATMLARDSQPLPARNKKADGAGVAAVRMAPSNKNVLYASYLGIVWRSADGGRSIRRCALPQKAMLSNAGRQRLYNRAIDVHPADPDAVIVGTWGEGAWHSADGGATWRELLLPAAGKSLDDRPGLYFVLFDEVAPDHVYVFVTGVGLFCSVTGPSGDFAECAGGPTHCSNLVAARDGSVLVCEDSTSATGRLWRYLPQGGWTTVTPPRQLRVVAVNPNDHRHLLGANGDGTILSSKDGGINWRKEPAEWSRSGGEVGWIGDLKRLFPAHLMFNPRTRDTALIAQGVGVCRATFSSGAVTFTDWSAGIEELVPISALSVPGGSTHLTALDKPFWRLDDDTAYNNEFRYPRDPSQQHSPDTVAAGSFLDYAADDAKFLVGVVNAGGSGVSRRGPGYSPDGGENWYLFEGSPPRGWGVGGCIAASTKKNFVLLPSNNGVGCYTFDGGRSWDSIRLDGVHETARFANAYYVVRKNITADKRRPGTFALVYTVIQSGGDAYGNPLGGIWVTHDGGQSWTQTLRGIANDADHSLRSVAQGQDNRQFWQCQLEYVPGFSRELMYTGHADYPDDRLWWSTDDGASWRQPNPSVRAVRSFGFGKPAPGSARPALYFSGKVGNVAGVFASFDWLSSRPHLVAERPSPLLADIVWVTGDSNRFGRAYLGARGGGWLIADVALSGS